MTFNKIDREQMISVYTQYRYLRSKSLKQSPGQCVKDVSLYFEGAWWYWHCDNSNLNGMYLGEQGSGEHGVIWDGFKGNQYSLKFTEMKIRPTK